MLIRLLREHLRPYKVAIIIVLTLQLVQTIASLYLPSLNADIIDQGVVVGDTGFIMRTGALMLAISAIQVVAAVVAVYFGARAAMGVGRDVRGRIFGRVQTFSAREVGTFGAPSLITRTTNDVQQVQMLVMLGLTMMVTAPIMLIGGVIMALGQDVQLSGLLLVIVPILGVTVGLIIWRMIPNFRKMQVRIDRINAVLREQITGIRVVRAFVRERQESARFGEANTGLFDVSLRVGKLMALAMPAVMAIMNLSSIAVVWFGGLRIDSGEMEVGALLAFLSYIMFILMAVMMSTMIFMMVPRAAVSADRITQVLDTETTVVDAHEPVRLNAPSGLLEFDNVQFGYPGAQELVLHDVSFTAAPGRTTAIIGSTGSGKTSLINLIPRLFDVTGGRILLDGVDVRSLALDDLWSMIGLVPQRAYLFSGTVASNLRYGAPDADDDELWGALRVAQGETFVREMERGLQSDIAQGGTNVSGGQRQRLAIARAVVRAPKVYLFDDSFSALDYATDAALRAALVPEVKDATVVLVAQRVATIRHADQIIVLDNGRIVGTGTHEELLEANETYQEIVFSQLSAEEAA